MKIKKAQFLISSPDFNGCPELNLPEFALLGRSNVGKSSFINTLANNFKLAKTSNTPGKTRLINLFVFNDDFVIADLPGYGYAKVSKTEQAKWQKNLENYLLKRNLTSCIQFIDARHEIQKNDIQMREWLNVNSLKVFTVATKADLISKNELQKRISEIQKAFGGEVFAFHSKNQIYRENMLNHIENLCAKNNF